MSPSDHPPTDGPGFEIPEDRELERVLREQTLLPVPLALVGRILDQALPVEPVRPWVLAGRAAAAILIFLGSWLAFSGEVPALADVSPGGPVAGALAEDLSLADAATAEATGVLESTHASEVSLPVEAWCALGLIVLVGGAILSLRWHVRAEGRAA